VRKLVLLPVKSYNPRREIRDIQPCILEDYLISLKPYVPCHKHGKRRMLHKFSHPILKKILKGGLFGKLPYVYVFQN